MSNEEINLDKFMRGRVEGYDSTQHPTIDDVTDGLCPGELHVINGRPPRYIIMPLIPSHLICPELDPKLF